MVRLFVLAVAAGFTLFGWIALSSARAMRGRQTTIDELESTDAGRLEPGGEATISGPVSVLESASPERTGPESNGTDAAALWAWRLRRKEGAKKNNGWRTVEGELAVGEFTVDHGWDRVRVDAEALSTQVDDPFDSSQSFLDEPETDVYLGELDPINRFLERHGFADEGGIVSDVEVSISVGGKTTMPDKYQATVVRDGDELIVRGDLIETADGYVLRGSDETPLSIAAGDLQNQEDRLRSEVRMRKAVSGVCFGLGVLVAILAVL
ncbi:hypothetical protein HTZ84_18105 [Haloterrigena sp. SYSU A558-1]|uniref:RING-type E3 ubiquitin transferase n=1 Tax=Haloterrigena gelatinilytica TaxID=2741724 RepID=A0ABX2LIH9_9EURY|nr:hypothetical protein [Haloterrigena gelatinilytica]NUC74193.1 hypothetical protein [Haloterrigena gelatinilytica]